MSEPVFGFDEWVPDPRNVAKAVLTVAKLERKYEQLTGRKITIVDGPEPSGSGALGEMIPETGQIILYESAGHKLSLGAKAEELLHYFSYRGRGLIGRAAKDIGAWTIYSMEVLVERLLEKSGFIRFRRG